MLLHFRYTFDFSTSEQVPGEAQCREAAADEAGEASPTAEADAL